MQRHVAVEELLRDLKSFAARKFPKEEVDAYLTQTLLDEATLGRCVSYSEQRYTRP